MAKNPKRIMRALKINEISAVDRPAQPGAVALIMKRDEGDGGEKSFDKMSALTTDHHGHSHLIRLNGGEDGLEMVSGETSWNSDHTHPWVRGNGGEIIIGVATGSDGIAHTHDIGALSKAKDEDDDDDAEVDGDELEPGKKAKSKSKQVKEKNSMTDKTSKSELEAAVQRAEKAEADMEFLLLLNALSSTHKAHYDAMDAELEDDSRKEFVAKSEDEREAIVKKAADDAEAERVAKAKGEQEVYKAADGSVFTAADDPRMVAMAKRNDELEAKLAKADADVEAAEYVKRAEELAHLPGSEEVRIAMLKSIDGIEDEATRKSALEALKSKDAGLADAYANAGVQAASNPTGDKSAVDKLDDLAKKHAEANKLGFAKAYDEVIQTAEGRALYAASTGDDQIGQPTKH